MTTTDWIATIALIISILSASFTGAQVYLQILQYQQDNHPLVATTIFLEDYKLRLRNPSNRTALIDHWELLWRKPVFQFFHKVDRVVLFYGDDFSLSIDPGKSVDLNFKEPFSFPTEPRGRGKLYIKLYPSGAQRPYLLFTGHPYSERGRFFFEKKLLTSVSFSDRLYSQPRREQ